MQLILSFENEIDFDFAKTAIKKQTPKKPVFYDIKFRQCGSQYGQLVTLERAYDCPCCRHTLWERDKYNFCPSCGQALDWSDKP